MTFTQNSGRSHVYLTEKMSWYMKCSQNSSRFHVNLTKKFQQMGEEEEVIIQGSWAVKRVL